MNECPFEILGLAPTLDPVAIKRAYFHALSRHGPTKNPDAFAKVRRAYESLAVPGAALGAWMRAPLSANERNAVLSQPLAQELEEYEKNSDARREAAQCTETALHAILQRPYAQIVAGR